MYWAAFIAGLCNGLVIFILETIARASKPKPPATPGVAGD